MVYENLVRGGGDSIILKFQSGRNRPMRTNDPCFNQDLSLDVFNSYDSEMRLLRKKTLNDLKLLKNYLKRDKTQAFIKIKEILTKFYTDIDILLKEGLNEIGSLAEKSSDEVLFILKNPEAKVEPNVECLMNDIRELNRNKFVSVRQVNNYAQSIINLMQET